MFMQRFLVLLLATALCGCDPRTEAKRRSAREAKERLCKETESTLGRARSLTFTWSGPIPDGGSWVFNFKSDAGDPLELLFLHGNVEMHGSPDFQVIRICGGKVECDVQPGTTLEARLIQLLSSARIAPEDPDGDGKPSREQLQWVISRMTNRTGKGTSVPD